ncbi:hypothetical protein GW17_00033449 [Ensete ventricosum]|nr:hypothetical protein GW17_00033449 [Ensete ventricosum]
MCITSREWLTNRAAGVFGFADVSSVVGHCGCLPYHQHCSSCWQNLQQATPWSLFPLPLSAVPSAPENSATLSMVLAYCSCRQRCPQDLPLPRPLSPGAISTSSASRPSFSNSETLGDLVLLYFSTVFYLDEVEQTRHLPFFQLDVTAHKMVELPVKLAEKLMLGEASTASLQQRSDFPSHCRLGRLEASRSLQEQGVTAPHFSLSTHWPGTSYCLRRRYSRSGIRMRLLSCRKWHQEEYWFLVASVRALKWQKFP